VAASLIVVIDEIREEQHEQAGVDSTAEPHDESSG
jgi:hypothetical protein